MNRRVSGSIPVLGSCRQRQPVSNAVAAMAPRPWPAAPLTSRKLTVGFATIDSATESLRLLPPEYAPATTSAYGSSEVWRSMAATSAPMRASGRFLSRANMRSVSRPVISSRSGSCCGQ